MDKTPFAGLTRLDPAEALSTDGYSFQALNPLVIDRLLRIAVQTHRHDAHVALGDPINEPELFVSASGGTIPGDTEVLACYTLVDQYGGETLPSPTVSITTPLQIEPPQGAPDFDPGVSASGNLATGIYYYSVSFVDAQGGETPVGEPTEVVVASGENSVVISGLALLLEEDVNAVAWKLWRSNDFGQSYYLTEGTAATDAVVDDGRLCIDCTDTPPLENSTMGANAVTLVLPAAAPSGASAYRVYMTATGTFVTPSFVEELPVASGGVPRVYSTLLLDTGAPPDVSLAVGGAAQINPDTDILDWSWRTAVASYEDLPAGELGHLRLVLDTGILYYVAQAVADEPGDWTAITGGGGSGGVGFTWEGAYDGSLAYNAYDVVSASGQSWIAVAPAASGEVPGEAVEWELVAASGAPGAPGSGGVGGHIIADESTPLTQRETLNFVGVGVEVTDDAGASATVVTITAAGGASGATGPPGSGFTWEGTYNNATNYDTNDVVASGGSSWITTAPTVGVAPPNPPWQLVAASGATGASGAVGPQGPAGSGSVHVIQDEGTPAIERAALNFVGAGVAVTDDAVGSATVVTIPGGSPSRATRVLTTPAIASGGTASGFVQLAPGYRILRTETDKPARVRLYTRTARRDADAARAHNVDPTGDHGLVTEVLMSPGSGGVDMSPVPHGFNMWADVGSVDAPSIPYHVQNLGASGAVNVTFTWQEQE